MLRDYDFDAVALFEGAAEVKDGVAGDYDKQCKLKKLRYSDAEEKILKYRAWIESDNKKSQFAPFGRRMFVPRTRCFRR